MKVTAKRAKYTWIISRCLFILVPLIHTLAHLLHGDWFASLRWFSVAVIVAILILQERNAFHHGFHFGQVMIMWCISHDITPQEFAEMPEPEPWDLPWSTKITKGDDDHG